MDKVIRCSVCGSEFFFTDKEQDFYKKMRFNLPKKCPNCRKKNQRKNTSKIYIKDFNGLAINLYEIRSLTMYDYKEHNTWSWNINKRIDKLNDSLECNIQHSLKCSPLLIFSMKNGKEIEKHYSIGDEEKLKGDYEYVIKFLNDNS